MAGILSGTLLLKEGQMAMRLTGQEIATRNSGRKGSRRACKVVSLRKTQVSVRPIAKGKRLFTSLSSKVMSTWQACCLRKGQMECG